MRLAKRAVEMVRVTYWVQNVWTNHLTKSWGYLQVGLGAFLMYLPQLQPFIKPFHYALFFMACGMLTAVIGYRNSRQQNQDHKEDSIDAH